MEGVSQVGAALSTAGYMFLEVAPHAPTRYVGCRGFEGTIAQEGVVNPVRKAYQVGGDGSWIFLHGGFPKLKKGILDTQVRGKARAAAALPQARCHAQPPQRLQTAWLAGGGHRQDAQRDARRLPAHLPAGDRAEIEPRSC